MCSLLVSVAVHPVFSREEKDEVSYGIDKGCEYVIENVVSFSLLGVFYDVLAFALLRVFSFLIPCYLDFVPRV